MNLTIQKLDTELEPFDIYALFKDEKESIFLDSGRDPESLGRYSFIGIHPFLTFKSKGNICNVNGAVFEGDTFTELNNILNKYKIENKSALPFVCGGMGYFSYDLARQIEELPSIATEELDIPDCYFNFYDNIIIVDNLKRETYITALGILVEGSKSLLNIVKKINCGNAIKYEKIEESTTIFTANFTKNEYVDTVEKVRQYIRNGDIYITNLTQRFCCDTDKEAFEVYKNLRHSNPAPFAAFMKLEGFNIVSSSPERFLKIANRKVETRPIKGTRPRGKNKEEDLKYKMELMESEKDKAELLMIVDLERNDLSRVCKPHSVKVTELFKLETYSTVHHLVSTIVGELKEAVTTIDCIKDCFPGGSITGAPKIRSMEIIEELEPTRRNIYTGSIGYIGFDGNSDLNIVIRTIVMKEKKAFLGVGGGITWDSESEAEYEETLDKAKALRRVL